MKVTIATIAEQAHVSVSLVSQVLNGKKVRVSDQTRQRIMKVAHDLDYQPNRLASAMRQGHTHVFALIVPFTPVGFFSQLVYYVEHYAATKGYTTVVINNFEDPDKELSALKMYDSHLFDGLAIAALSEKTHAALYKKMDDAGFPYVFVDRANMYSSAPQIRSDHYGVACNLVKKAVADGIDDLIFLRRTDRLDNQTSTTRFNGYTDTMGHLGLKARMYGFNYVDRNFDSLKTSLRYLPKAKGYFLHSGYYFPLIYKALCEYGSLDDDVRFYSVDSCVFDYYYFDDTVTRLPQNNLLVQQDTKTIAKVTVDTLLARIEGKSVSPLHLIPCLEYT
ncbi:MAG: LacI family transcriptional regulator [Spirochaetia bacterium]|nr:LacI family transcriptional regulator [Spirochaetia bacterium]